MRADDDVAGAPGRVAVTVRIDRPDGTVTEILWDDSGQVTTTRTGVAADAGARSVAGFDAGGSFLLDEQPEHEERETNPYGAVVERSRHRDGTVVERSYDGEANLRRVRVTGAWGAQSLEVRPDGSRTLRWRTAGLRGARSWDAGGAPTSSLVELVPDGLAEHTWDF